MFGQGPHHHSQPLCCSKNAASGPFLNEEIDPCCCFHPCVHMLGEASLSAVRKLINYYGGHKVSKQLHGCSAQSRAWRALFEMTRGADAQVMQVKNFGRRGRTKHTHLVDVDTTNREDLPIPGAAALS